MLQPKLTDVKPLDNFRLLVFYENNEKKVFDVKPYINGDWFSQLQNPDYFRTVRVSGYTVEWAGGQDIAPHELYDYGVEIGLMNDAII